MGYNETYNILLDLYNKLDTISPLDKKRIYGIYLYNIRKLAYKGHPDAQYDLAQHYEDMGIWGMPNPYHNITKKKYWYKKAANNNNAAANNNLAYMYEKGEGCNINIEKAMELYKKSSDLGDPNGKKNYELLKKQMKEKDIRL